MRITLTILLLSALFLVGCADDSSLLTSPEAQITQQSTSPNWVKLPSDIRRGPSVETLFSTEKFITGENGGIIRLDVVIPRPGNQLGDFEIHVKVQVQDHSFPDQEQRLFTIALDPEYSLLYISPSPNTLEKQLIVDFKIEGIDVSEIDTDIFGFIYVDDNDQILETENQVLQLNSNADWIKIKDAEIIVPTYETSGGARYGFTR
ncbi:MAG: hypothetical protein IH852_00595 [Bacteroidetes bacterium]|nr:hypothetical protein [Bacteroidota bacterium]